MWSPVARPTYTLHTAQCTTLYTVPHLRREIEYNYFVLPRVVTSYDYTSHYLRMADAAAQILRPHLFQPIKNYLYAIRIVSTIRSVHTRHTAHIHARTRAHARTHTMATHTCVKNALAMPLRTPLIRNYFYGLDFVCSYVEAGRARRAA